MKEEYRCLKDMHMVESSEYRKRLSAEMQVSFEREPKKEGCRLQHLSTGCAAFFFKTCQEAEMNLRAAMARISPVLPLQDGSSTLFVGAAPQNRVPPTP